MSHIFSLAPQDRRTAPYSLHRFAPLQSFRFAALLLCLLTLCGGAARAQSFVDTGALSGGRLYHTATLLKNGKVLVAGGIAPSASNPFLNEAALYDPASGTFSPTGSMTTERFGHTATLLSSGKVLIAGGNNGPVSSAELYDPTTGTFTATGSMATFRDQGTATLLNDGTVLFAGGGDGPGNPVPTAELYNPTLGTFSYTTGDMTVERATHTATLLPDGKVLIAGGRDVGGSLQSADIYDPATKTFSATVGGDMTMPRESHSATLLRNGKVLLAGGFNGTETTASAELYNPAAGDFTATDDLEVARDSHTATLLGNGQVLIAGGEDADANPLSSAEIFDPATGPSGTFALTGSLTTARIVHTATLLDTGSVVVVGGTDGFDYPDVAELYQPVPTTITSFTPTSGTSGTSVVITGTNFTGASRVKFNGRTPAVFTVDSDTQITATVPAGTASGAIKVSASTLATSPTDFTVAGTTPPTVSSIKRAAGSTNPTSGASVVFTVIFSEDVTGVDASDFSLTSTGSATGGIGSVIGSGTARFVTVTGVTGIGTLRLDVLDDDSIIDTTSYSLLRGFTTGQCFTIQAATTGATISEFSTRGHDGSDDEYIELVNNTNAPLNITGWTLQFESFGDPGSATVQGAVSIPARGHYLFGGNRYCGCDAEPDAQLSGDFDFNDVDDDSSIALLNAASGTMVDYIAATPRPDSDGDYAFVRNPLAPTTFQFVAIDGGIYTTSAGTLTAALGSPGPQNMASPVQRDDVLVATALDTAVALTVKPNQSRLGPTGPTDPNAPLGTLVFRRKLTNNSGAPVTKLRFRITRLTTLGSHAEGDADIRAISSADANVTTSAGIKPVTGTTINDPYTNEAIGGGVNCRTTDGTVKLSAPLAAGQSRNYSFSFRVVGNGTFKAAISFEALP